MRRKTMVLAGHYWFILVFSHIVLCSHSLRHHHGHAATAILSAEEATMGGPTSSSSSSLLASTSNVNNSPEDSQQQYQQQQQQQNSLLQQQQQANQQTLEDVDGDDSDLLLESSPLIMGSPSSSVSLEQGKPEAHRKQREHDDNEDEEESGGGGVPQSPPSLLNQDTSRLGSLHSDISSGGSIISASSISGSGNVGSISLISSSILHSKKQSMTEVEEGEDDVLNDEPASAGGDVRGRRDDESLALFQRDAPIVAAPLVGSPPVLIHKIKVKPGHELKLKCDLNNTYGRIMWLLNGNPIRTDNGRYSIQGPTSRDRSMEGRLTINNVLPEDNGVWQCHETKFDGKEHVSKPIWVIVLAGPRAVHLEFDGRRISPSSSMVASSPSTRVTYREKDNVSIQCVVEGGNPPPKVYWYLGSKNMTNSSQIRSEFLEDDKIYITRSSLLIGNISRTDHNKSVVCVVDHELLNQGGSASGSGSSSSNTNVLQDSSAPLAPTSMALSSTYLKAMAHFNVEYAPSFVISRIPGFGYPIREGISMALKCEVDANPHSRPLWMKDGGEPPVSQSGEGFLNFTTVNRNHTGWYKCISHHPLGKFSSVGYYLTVRFEPSIVHQPPPRVEASLGDKLHMKCEAEGRPSPALCWSRIGYGGSLTTVGSGQDLILDKILYQEAGNYRCVAQNRVGLEERRSQTHDILVVVSGRPVVYPTNRTVMGFAGQPLSLSVEMCANPAPERAFWIFGSVALRPGSRHRNKYVAQKLSASDRATDCFLAVLTILNVSEDDAGEYMFFVKNAKGVHEGTILLNITQASYSVSVSTSRAYGDSHVAASPSSAQKLGFWNCNNLANILLCLTLALLNRISYHVLTTIQSSSSSPSSSTPTSHVDNSSKALHHSQSRILTIFNNFNYINYPNLDMQRSLPLTPSESVVR